MVTVALSFLPLIKILVFTTTNELRLDFFLHTVVLCLPSPFFHYPLAMFHAVASTVKTSVASILHGENIRMPPNAIAFKNIFSNCFLSCLFTLPSLLPKGVVAKMAMAAKKMRDTVVLLSCCPSCTCWSGC